MAKDGLLRRRTPDRAPRRPNLASCHGQAVSELARAGEGGFAGFAERRGLSVQEAQAVAERLAGIKCPPLP